MLASTLSVPWHRAQRSISMPNTRFRRCAQVIAAWRATAGCSSPSAAYFLPLPLCAGVMAARRLLPRHQVLRRAVETIDFMTAHWARLPYDFLDVCSRRIVNEVKGISRVVYHISGKPPATIEWE